MPSSTSRSDVRGLPVRPLMAGFCGGINGSISAHNSSLISRGGGGHRRRHGPHPAPTGQDPTEPEDLLPQRPLDAPLLWPHRCPCSRPQGHGQAAVERPCGASPHTTLTAAVRSQSAERPYGTGQRHLMPTLNVQVTALLETSGAGQGRARNHVGDDSATLHGQRAAWGLAVDGGRVAGHRWMAFSSHASDVRAGSAGPRGCPCAGMATQWRAARRS